MESGIDLLDQEDGLGPGAVETSWLYDLTVQPLVAEVHNIVSKKGGIISTIVDDFSIVTTFDSMVEALKVLVKKVKRWDILLTLIKHNIACHPYMTNIYYNRE